MAEVQGEIQAIIRQITASVSFLPMIDDPCTFEMLVYTDKDTETPLVSEHTMLLNFLCSCDVTLCEYCVLSFHAAQVHTVGFVRVHDQSGTSLMFLLLPLSHNIQEWQESDAKLVKGGKQVMPLRQFSTNIHTVSAHTNVRQYYLRNS